MASAAKVTTSEILVLPLYAILDLLLDLPWITATIVGVVVVAAVCLFPV